MRFMTMLKAREDAAAPPPDFFEAMGAYIAGVAASGKLITTGGLLPSSTGAELRATAGEVVVTHGPFTEATELIGGFAIFDVDSRDEAITLATEFVQLHVDHWPGWEGALEIRQIMQPPGR